MLRLGVLSNSTSKRNRNGLPGFQAVLDTQPQVVHKVVDRAEDVGDALQYLARETIDLLVVNAGDGTVHAALTELLVSQPFESLPLLVVLPGGTNNTIAKDISGSRRRRVLLERLLTYVRENTVPERVVTRNVIRLDYDGARNPLHGMFFGAAGISRGIEWRRQLQIPRWYPETLVLVYMFARFLGGRIITGHADGGIFRGDEITVELDGQQHRLHPSMALMVTTMERVALGCRPYWGSLDRPLKFTSIAAKAPRLGRYILPLLYGGRERNLPPDDYFSGSFDKISLRLRHPFVLDGEFFDPSGSQTISLSAVCGVKFVRC